MIRTHLSDTKSIVCLRDYVSFSSPPVTITISESAGDTMEKLQGVADTLFIPLAARIYVSKRFPEYFYDETALALENTLPIGEIQNSSSEYFMMASVARYYHMDAITKAFIATHGICNIVNLGAGLETACSRIGHTSAIFYEVDLPEVIERRKAILPPKENEVLLGGDLFALEWVQEIDTSLPTLFLASGVFQYFHEVQILQLISGLKTVFPNGELLFDATTEKGLRSANRYVKKTGNTDAMMYFFVDDCRSFAQKSNTILLDYRPFFTEARKMPGKKLTLYTRIAMKIVDEHELGKIIHLKL